MGDYSLQPFSWFGQARFSQFLSHIVSTECASNLFHWAFFNNIFIIGADGQFQLVYCCWSCSCIGGVVVVGSLDLIGSCHCTITAIEMVTVVQDQIKWRLSPHDAQLLGLLNLVNLCHIHSRQAFFWWAWPHIISGMQKKVADEKLQSIQLLNLQVTWQMNVYCIFTIFVLPCIQILSSFSLLFSLSGTLNHLTFGLRKLAKSFGGCPIDGCLGSPQQLSTVEALLSAYICIWFQLEVQSVWKQL